MCENKKWSDIGRLLGYTGVPGLSTQIKQSYARVILPYEDFCRRNRNVGPTVPPSRSTPSKSVPPVQTPAPTPAQAPKSQTPTATTSKLSHENVASISGMDLVPTSPLSSPSSTLSELPDEEDPKPKPDCMLQNTILYQACLITYIAAPKFSTGDVLPTIPAPIFHDRPNLKGANEVRSLSFRCIHQWLIPCIATL